MNTVLMQDHTPPGPHTLPLLGERAALAQFFRDPIACLTRLSRQYGPVVAFTRHRPTWLAVFGASANQELLTRHDLFHAAQLPFTPPAGTALQRMIDSFEVMDSAQHKHYRQLMQPFFRHQQVTAYATDVVMLAQQMLDHWRMGEQRDICQEMHDLTFRITTRAFFGVISDTDATTLGAEACRWLALASSLSAALLPFNLPCTPFHDLCTLSAWLETRYRAIIADTRAHPSQHANLVSALLQARDAQGVALTDEAIAGHLHLIAVTGTGSNATGLAWTLFLLAQHPAILAELRDEIDGVLHGAAPTADDLERLPLLERVVKESLRVLSPAAYLARRSSDSATLGGFDVPSNAWIIYSPYVTQHLPEIYAEPERFRPERWLGGEPPPYAYIPFGAGAHACIGALFAMMTIRLTLALILQRFSLQVVPGARIDRQVQISMTPKYGMPMIVLPRDARLKQTQVRGNIHEMVDLT